MPILNVPKKIAEHRWSCPCAENLGAYIDGTLSEAERLALERHLADCGYCLSLVAGAISDMDAPALATPAWLRQKAQALAGEKSSKSARWAWAVAPALACLLVVAVLVEYPRKPGKLPPPGGSVAFTAPQTSSAPGELTRSRNSRPEPLRLLVPANGAVIERRQLGFEWKAIPNAYSYQIRITAPDGGLVWQERSEQPNAQPPRTLQLAAKDYWVWVTAYLEDGRELHFDPVEFRVKP